MECIGSCREGKTTRLVGVFLDWEIFFRDGGYMESGSLQMYMISIAVAGDIRLLPDRALVHIWVVWGLYSFFYVGTWSTPVVPRAYIFAEVPLWRLSKFGCSSSAIFEKQNVFL